MHCIPVSFNSLADDIFNYLSLHLNNVRFVLIHLSFVGSWCMNRVPFDIELCFSFLVLILSSAMVLIIVMQVSRCMSKFLRNKGSKFAFVYYWLLCVVFIAWSFSSLSPTVLCGKRWCFVCVWLLRKYTQSTLYSGLVGYGLII